MRRKKTMHIRLRLLEVLEQKNISQAKLSRMSDISYNTILDLCRNPIRPTKENPNRSVNVLTLEKIARALKVSVLDLYEVIPDEEDEE